MQTPALEPFSDRSRCGVLVGSRMDRRSNRSECPVRVPAYQLAGIEESPILAMSQLDFFKALAEEFAAYCHERWETETACDKIKTNTIVVPS